LETPGSGSLPSAEASRLERSSSMVMVSDRDARFAERLAERFEGPFAAEDLRDRTAAELVRKSE